MAINPQLKEYIDQQAKLGVSNDVIKSALLGAGWQEGDVNEAMAGLASSANATAAKPGEIKAIVKPMEVQSAGSTDLASFDSVQDKSRQASSPQVKSSDASPALSKFSPGSGPQGKSAPVPFVTSDIFQPKDEPVFESKAAAARTPFPENKPQVVSAAGRTGTESGGSFFRKLIVPIVLGAFSLLFAVAAGSFYVQNSGLQAELSSANQENASLNGQLSSFTSDKNGLTDQIASLNQTVNDLSNQLSLFAVSSGTSTTELPMDIKGALGGGGKSLYSLTTNKAIVVYVKNSKDAKVDSTLKPLLGNQVEISGTHTAGLNFVTVTGINGRPLESLVQPTSTSAFATSTNVVKASSTVPNAATSTAP